MSPSLPHSRRHFLKTSVAACAGAFAASSGVRAADDANPRRLVGFTKPFQSVGFEQTVEVVSQVGWSGIECPVRAKGQVLPERVEDDLPALQELLKKRGLEIGIITTDVGGIAPIHERVLKTAARLGIKHYRLTYKHYDLAKPIPPQLAEYKAQLRDLAALNKELGITGGIKNHSGRTYIGAPLWDLHELLHDIDPAHLGVHFDIGHATVEGGTSWPIDAQLLEPLLSCVYVKDFAWEKTAQGWRPKWGPLGDGMIRPEFFKWLKQSTFRGPISVHCEYLEGGNAEQIAVMKKDTDLLKTWLSV